MRKDFGRTRRPQLVKAGLLMSGLGLWGLGIGSCDTAFGGTPESAQSAQSVFYESGASKYDIQPVSLFRECGPPASCGDGGCDTDGDGEADPCEGLLMPIFVNHCGDNWLADNGILIGGFTAFSYTFNPDRPASRTNGPTTFVDRSNDFLFNALNMFVVKDVDTESDCVNVGGRVDFMAGSDTRFTKSLGFDDGWATNSEHYSLAMPQVYAEVFLPVLNGITVKAGHFYTPIGYEVVPATGNFFVSHAYTMQYGEPFTHWGFLSSTNVSDNVTVMSGSVAGWDDLENNLDGNWSWLGGAVWTGAETGTSVALTGIAGNEGDALGGRAPRYMYSLVVTQDLGNNWQYVFQHDQGIQRNGGPNGETANWYGVNQYLFYTVSDCLKLGARAEWFRDDEGVRVFPLTPTGYLNNSPNFYEVTLGANYAPTKCIMIRPEIRYDWADDHSRPFDDGTDGKQWLFITDVVIRF